MSENNNAPAQFYGNLVPLDRVAHKNLRLKTDISSVHRVAKQNSMFLAVVEFSEACKEYPIVFVRVGAEAPKEGEKPTVAPLAVMGLKPGSNLFVDGDEFKGMYAPAFMRRYPFSMVRVDETSDTMAVCYDADWKGFNESDGASLFAADGQPTEFLVNAQKFLENFDMEAERTRQICAKLIELDLLRDMRFQATVASGEQLEVDGFMCVDEDKFAALPDATVLELFRNGILSLLEMHRVSMGNMNRLATKQSEVKAA